jgi:hypothetical protein
VKPANRLLALVLTITACAALSGCGAPPDQVVSDFMKAVTAMQADEMRKYVASSADEEFLPFQESDPSSDPWIQAVMDRITYEVQKPVISKNSATVPVTITCVDLVRVMTNMLPDLFSLALGSAFGDEPEMDMDRTATQLLVNSINDPNAPMVTTNMEFNLTKGKKGWLIVFDDATGDALANAITGNLGTFTELWE